MCVSLSGRMTEDQPDRELQKNSEAATFLCKLAAMIMLKG